MKVLLAREKCSAIAETKGDTLNILIVIKDPHDWPLDIAGVTVAALAAAEHIS